MCVCVCVCVCVYIYIYIYIYISNEFLGLFFTCANAGFCGINQLFYNAVPIRDSVLLGCNIVSVGEVAADVLKALSSFVPSGRRRVAYLTMKMTTLQSFKTSNIQDLHIQ